MKQINIEVIERITETGIDPVTFRMIGNESLACSIANGIKSRCWTGSVQIFETNDGAKFYCCGGLR